MGTKKEVSVHLLDVAPADERHEGGAFGCAYTPDGAFVLSAGWDGYLRLWEASTGQHVASLQASPRPLSACAVSPDGGQFLAGSMDGLFGIWEAVSHQPYLNFVAHTRPISGICFSPDGETLATSSWDRQVILRRVGKEREPGRTLSGHQDIVGGCRFLADGKHLLSWSHDTTVRLWDTEAVREVCVLRGHADRVTSASVSPDGKLAASAGRDGVIRLWDLAGRVEVGSADLGCELCLCLFLPDGESLATVDAGGRILVLEVPGFEVQAELETRLRVQCGVLSPSGQQLTLGGEDGSLYRFGLAGLEEVSLVVTATPMLKESSSLLGRLVGSTRLKRTYQFTCPACRHQMEMANLPRQTVACTRCRRTLRVHLAEPLLA